MSILASLLWLMVMFRANRGPRPSVDGLVSVDGLAMAGHPRSPDGLAFLTKTKAFWVIKYLIIYSTNK